MASSAWISSLLSALFRVLSYTFLRIIPARQYYPAYACFAGYLILWLFNDAKIKYIENTPQRTLLKQSDLASSRKAEGQQYAVNKAGEQNDHTNPKEPGSPSYSQIVAAGKKKKLKAAQQLATVDPSIEAQTRGIHVPSRPSILTYITGGCSQSRVANRFSLFINVLLLASCFDFQFSPFFLHQEKDLAFARVGVVGDTFARIVARVPPLPSGTAREDGELLPTEITLVYRQTQPVGSWLRGPVLSVTNASDFTGVVELADLEPSTQYEYRWALGRTFHPYFKNAFRFTTWADPRLSAEAGSHFKFASTSCMVPGWPYNPLNSVNGKRLDMPGVDHLAKGIKDKGIEWLLYVGDFIYVDVPFYFGVSEETYRRKYRQVYSSSSWKQVYEQIPTVHIYDDHEIFNDFSSGNATSGSKLFGVANKAWREYQGSGNPASPAGLSSDTNYYWFRNGDTAFFVWDTRKYRSPNGAPDNAEKTMLGDVQRQVFLDWLQSTNETVTWKFVISSVPFMTLWSPAEDTWSAFETERTLLMDAMEYVPNLIVLSGDRHEFAAAAIRKTVLEFSTSPLSQFYLPVRTLSQQHGRGATGEDVLLKYLPDGNSKYTTFEVDTRTKNRPTVKVEVVIDGQSAWELTILGKVVHKPAVNLGRLAPSLAELLGFIRRRWF